MVHDDSTELDEQTKRDHLEETHVGQRLLQDGFTVNEAYRVSMWLCSIGEDTPDNKPVREEASCLIRIVRPHDDTAHRYEGQPEFSDLYGLWHCQEGIRS